MLEIPPLKGSQGIGGIGLTTKQRSFDSLIRSGKISEFGVSLTGAYVTQKGPQSGIRPKKPIVYVELSTDNLDTRLGKPCEKRLTNKQKVNLRSRFHPETILAGRQDSPPVKGNKSLVSVGEPQVSGLKQTLGLSQETGRLFCQSRTRQLTSLALGVKCLVQNRLV